MSWTRWFAVLFLATLGAFVVSIGAGDFDGQKRRAAQRAAIEQARETSGVAGTLTPVVEGTSHGR